MRNQESLSRGFVIADLMLSILILSAFGTFTAPAAR